MRRRKNVKRVHSAYEFELDLAPLLSVMVKLVPVLLISSAFVQVMMVESDLPQAVKQAIVENQKEENEKPTLQLTISKKTGVTVKSHLKDKILDEQTLATSDNGSVNMKDLHALLVSFKQKNPSIFRLEIKPESDVPYSDIVKIMDEARRSRDRSVRFEFTEPKTDKKTQTDYMFPDIVFANMMEG